MGFRVAKGNPIETTSVSNTWGVGNYSAKSIEEKLFNDNCAACHQNRSNFQGLYGKNKASLFKVVKEGGNNVMSMPAFGPRLTDDEISLIVMYVIQKNSWTDKGVQADRVTPIN
ncbi:MAG: cytochrome c [Gammaproteobacteria bacterium]|nr:cytochrome c [Gammaproteobacteria bacterium]